MVNGVNRAEGTAPAQSTAVQQQGGTDAFAALLAQELSGNEAYLNALKIETAAQEAIPKDKGYALPSFGYASNPLIGKVIQEAEAAALQVVYGGPYSPEAKAAAVSLNAEEKAALQAARAALLLPPIQEESAEAAEEAATSENALSSLFGGDVNLGEMLMLMMMMLAGGGMGMDGESGGMSSGMGVMMASLGKAMAQKNTQEQERLRYDMLTDGYKTNNASEALDEAATYVNETLFSETSEANFPYRASKPATPLVTSTETNRDPALYRQVIDQFSVTENPRYQPNKKGTGDTYCNIYLWDVTSAMGAEIPHYTDWDTGEILSYPDVDDAKFMNANRIYDWLGGAGQQYGWREVSAEEAQMAANAGQPAVTIWKNPTGGHGHCQVVCPSLDGGYNADRGVTIAQAGNNLYDYAYIDQVYSSRLPDVKYYAHA